VTPAKPAAEEGRKQACRHQQHLGNDPAFAAPADGGETSAQVGRLLG